jgi:hypothetical protein
VSADGHRRQDGDAPVLVTLLGDEPLVSLVLARQLRPRRVICVGQPVVEWRVEPLLRILREEGCVADWLSVAAVDVPAGLAELEERLKLGPDQPVAFDLTSARSVLGFAMYELALARERAHPDRCRLLRVDWSDRLVRSISPDRAATEPLRAQVSLADYLGVHGKHLVGVERGPGSRSAFGQAARRIATSIQHAHLLLQATHRGSPDHPLQMSRRHAATRLVDGLIADGVLERQGQSVYASSPKAFQFLHGRWLEEYLFEIADASGAFDDCASGVRFSWSDDGDGSGNIDVTNEIDFAGTAGGRATIASCKTGGRDVNGPLYEILTLAERAAGRSVVTVFATIETLDRPARRRAAALGIRVLDAPRLADPAVVLRSLLNGTLASGPSPSTAQAR